MRTMALQAVALFAAYAWISPQCRPLVSPHRRALLTRPVAMCDVEGELDRLGTPGLNRARRWTAQEIGIIDQAKDTLTRTKTALRKKTVECYQATRARDAAASQLATAEACLLYTSPSPRD